MNEQRLRKGQTRVSGWEGWKLAILIVVVWHFYPRFLRTDLNIASKPEREMVQTKSVRHFNFERENNINHADSACGRAEFFKLNDSLEEIDWQFFDKDFSLGSKQAVKGGTFRMSFPAFPPTLRTKGRNSSNEFNRMLEKMVYETLLQVHPDPFFFYPSLAIEWAISPDGERFYFHLDPKARWADGREVTVDDVIATWRLAVNKGLEDPFAYELWSQFSEPVALADSQNKKFMVRSKKRGWRYFAAFATDFYILPAHVIADMSGAEFLKQFHNKMPIGSGSCVISLVDAPERLVLNRRPDYWAGHKPWQQGLYNFDQYQFYFWADSDLAFEKFKAGEIDYMSFVQARKWMEEMSFDKIQKGWIQKRRVISTKPPGVLGFSFNLRAWPFTDKNIRQALAYLWPRQEIIDKLMYGEYEPLASFFEGRHSRGKQVPIVNFNPQKAARLLADSGWNSRNKRGVLEKEGQELAFNLTYSGKGIERFLLIYQQELRQAGIVANLREMTWAARLQEEGNHNFQLTYGAVAGRLFPNPESLFHSKYAHVKNSLNIWGYQNPLVDQLCEQFENCFEPEKRNLILQEIDDLVTNDFIMVFCWYAPAERIAFWHKFSYPPDYFGPFGDYKDAVRFWWLDKEKESWLATGSQI